MTRDYQGDNFFKEWLKLYDDYSISVEKTWSDLMNDLISSPNYSKMQSHQLNVVLTFWEMVRNYQNQFFRSTGFASQHDVARLGQLVISLEDKVDQIFDLLDENNKSLQTENKENLACVNHQRKQKP